MKKTLIISILSILSLVISLPAFVSASERSVERPILSDTQTGAISQYCNSIRQTLKSVQKSDSYTRSHLGHSYEIILSSYITPLNLRLIKSNRPDTSLSSLQTDFVAAREKFNDDFVIYSRSLEELISIDCQTSPNDFYAKLQKTRNYRAVLRDDITALDTLIEKHSSTVKSLGETL